MFQSFSKKRIGHTKKYIWQWYISSSAGCWIGWSGYVFEITEKIWIINFFRENEYSMHVILFTCREWYKKADSLPQNSKGKSVWSNTELWMNSM